MDKKSLITAIEALGSEHEYMSETQYELFEAHLRHEKANMVESHSAAQLAFSNSEGRAADFVDKATLDSEREDDLRRESALKVGIRKADDAIRAIKLEEYGFCQDCGSDIGLPRLFSNPFALRDMECERANEIKSKQLSGARIKVY